MGRERLARARRWVVKIGSALVTAGGRGLDTAAIAAWTDELARLHGDGAEVLLVSSGAVAEGMSRLGWHQRPHALHELQAAASVSARSAWSTPTKPHSTATASAPPRSCSPRTTSATAGATSTPAAPCGR